MSDDNPATSGQIDKCCDLFESNWKGEKAFSIEDVLSKLAESHKTAYLKALMPVEIELRNRQEDVPAASEWYARFPEFVAVIDEVLANSAIEDSLDNQKTIAPNQTPTDSDDVPTTSGLRIPRQLGRYRIVRKLGQGAMGSVFLAHDEQLDRQVALKIPRGDLQRNREMRVRFEREAQAAASLHHPNICPIYDIAEFEDIHYICMGYIEGFSLSRYAIAESGLSEQRIAELVLKLSKALAVAHEAGFIHRDLKPANVMVDHTDEPVILDFGLARKIDRDEDIRVTQTGTTIGSPAYMSPEQVDGDQDKVGIHSDIYSLGVILYELLTGRIPFEGSLASVMGQIMTKQPDKPSDYRKDLSVRLENICLRMMAKDADKRPPSMHAVSAALQEYLDKFGNKPSQPAPVASPSTKSVDRGQQRKDQIQQLVKSGDYSQAEKLLVALSRETDASLTEAAAWAAAEIPVLRKTREEVRAGRQEMYSTASRLMKAHDYEQAVRLLEEYPYDLRTPKMQELLERAEAMSHEVKRLRKEIKAVRNRSDNAALLPLVDALLEIRPGDRRAKELREQLTKKSVGPISRAFGKKPPRFVDKIPAGIQWFFVGTVLVTACCYPAYQWAQNFLRNSEATVGSNPVADVEPEVPSDVGSPQPQPSTAPAPPAATPVAEDGRWTSLLDGDLNDHWEAYTGGAIGTAWKLSNGELTLAGKNGGDIATKLEFANFEFDFEWKISKGGNSGVIYISQAGDRQSYLTGPEYQILDDDGHPNGKSAKTSAGAMYSLIAPSGKTLKPVGQWNTARIIRNDNHIEHWLNGTRVVETTINNSAWNTLLKRNGVDKKWPRFAKAKEGRIVLQDHGDQVWFRKMRIRSTDAIPETIVKQDETPGWTSLFNGRNLSGWRTVGSNDGSAVQNGNISISMPKKNDAGIISVGRLYGDFEFEFEYRLQNAGNSGVRIRVPDIPNVNIDQCLEIQLIDDTAAKYKDIADWQKNGAIYGLNGPSRSEANGPNKWHRMNILAIGPNIVVRVNGRQVSSANVNTDKTSTKAPPPHLKNPRGLIAFSGPGNVDLRNIRIRETATPTPPRSYPVDAAEFNGHHYKVYYDQKNWAEAKQACEAYGGHLAVVTSDTENDFIRQLAMNGLKNRQRLDGIWLGATDERREGNWVWVDGTPMTYKTWQGKQPNNKQGLEHYLLMWLEEDGQWVDQPQSSTQHRTFFVCEWDR